VRERGGGGERGGGERERGWREREGGDMVESCVPLNKLI